MHPFIKAMSFAGIAAALPWHAVAGDKDLEAAALPGTDLVVRAHVHELLAAPAQDE